MVAVAVAVPRQVGKTKNINNILIKVSIMKKNHLILIGIAVVSVSVWKISLASKAKSGAYKVPFISSLQILPPIVARFLMTVKKKKAKN